MRYLNTSVLKHRYEFGRATVLVRAKAASNMDGMIRCGFACQVHPAAGGPVYECEVMEFFPWSAANAALKKWNENKEENENQ